MAVFTGQKFFHQSRYGAAEYFQTSIFFIASFWVLNQAAYFFTLREGLSTFYPPSGFAMFLVYYLGVKYLPVHFVAILAGGLPQRDVFNYSFEMLVPDLRQFIIYGVAGLVLREINKAGGTFHPLFFYSAVGASVITAAISSLFFTTDINEPVTSYGLEWLASTSSFFIGNLTGAIFALPLFVLFVYLKSTGLKQATSDFLSMFLALDKALMLFSLLALVFLIVSLTNVSAEFSNYYYFIIIPMIWASVKWGLCLGLVYAFLGNSFALFLWHLYDYSGYSSLEGQVIFSVSVISSIFIGLAHKEKNDLYEQSMYDELTGLPNMRLFKDLSALMIANADRDKHLGAFLFVDIDGFKSVNDSLGHQVGDDLLREIADRLKRSIRESDVVARVGGDEFVIQLRDVRSTDGAETVALKVIDNISMPFYFDDSVATVGASVGASMYPQHGEDMDTLLGKADQAMYAAKKSGKNVWRLYAD